MPRTLFIAVICILTAFTAAAEDEQLPRDPGNIYGQLDSGLRYILRKNATPPNKVTLYLHVKSGALNETERQNGIAHFLEHMAFKGSTHYRPGELVPLLNRLGMSYGADTNAHTNLHETVYKLTIPDTQAPTIDTALTVFSDYVAGLLLRDEDIDSERNVILEEQRARLNAAQRLRKKTIKELFPGTRLAVHDVLGEEERIRSFTRADFVDYWNAWYRPENVTLIVVGDINTDDIAARANEKLGGLKARVAARPPLKAGLKPFTAPRAIVMTDPEQAGADVELVSLREARPSVLTRSQYRLEFIEDLSLWIVNRRFSERIREGGAAFRTARVGSQDQHHEALMVYAAATGEAQDWNHILDASIAEISRAIDHGFTSDELELAKRTMIAGAERAVQTEATRDSRAVAIALARAVGLDRPILSAQQHLDLRKEIVADITLADLHKVFSTNFKAPDYTYVVTLPEATATASPSKDDINAAASAAWAKKTQPPQALKLADAILASEPDPGRVVKQQTDQDLAVTTATFANGVVMHHKFIEYKKDYVAVSIVLPGGTIEETADNRGISDVASMMLARPATSRFTSSQIHDLLSGKNTSLSGGVGFDALSISLSGSPKDLALGLQLTHAILSDGTLEQTAFDDWRKSARQDLLRRKTSAPAQLGQATGETVFGGDIRFMPLTDVQINRQERDRVARWFKRIASHAAIEATVVGDVHLDDAVNLIARYLGSLPKRGGGFSDLDHLRTIERAPGPFLRTVPFEGITPKAMVAAGFLTCDARDPVRRPLTLASLVLTDRMITRIRQDEQMVYSIRCQNSPAVSIPGTGTISAGAPTDPKNADRLADTILAMLNEFAETGPTDQELATAKKQIANQLSSQMKEPDFWLTQLGDSLYRGRPLAELKELPAVYETFTAKDVRDAVMRYSKRENVVRVLAIPQGTRSNTTPTTSKVGAEQP